MKNILNSKWIKSPEIIEDASCEFIRNFDITKPVKSAFVEATAYGVYDIELNGETVGDQVLAPGWTAYQKNLQVETYDISSLLKASNTLTIGVAPGWKGLTYFNSSKLQHKYLGFSETAAIAAIEIVYEDGTDEVIYTDEKWLSRKGTTVYSHLYNGYTYDPSFSSEAVHALPFPCDMDNLIDRRGEKIKEHEHLEVKEIIITPKGETVLDFGQNMTGYVQFRITGKKGEKVTIRHAEVLDAQGNFYNDNYRSAKAEASFICDGEEHTIKPRYNFFGFRYVRLENWCEEVKKENFTAIAVHSDMKRTGHFECSAPRVNKLFSNIIWGQKGNFLDVPTDCPQRDERLGWTGDAQVFVKTASYNFDVEKFFIKWLADLRADQTPWGAVPHVIPNVFSPDDECSAAWADAATICPWQIYQTYGNKQILEDSLKSMRDYLEYIEAHTWDNLWAHGHHFGDWLNLDGSSPEDCSHGTDKDLIATAYCIYSSEIYIKACEVCGKDPDTIPEMRNRFISAFRSNYMKNGRIKDEYATQTACVVACHFRISDNIPETAKQLNELVTQCGHLKTGFVGTPYLLHALSDNGYTKTAYDLLLREEYPSWLFSVKMGATTIWEHWDSMREDGTMWSTSMNSFNHYAYGSVADWLYGDAAGIKIDEKNPAFSHIIFAPLSDCRLDYVKASIDTRHGLVKSEWKKENDGIVYTFTVPEGCRATVVLNGKETEIESGESTFKQ